MAEGAIELEIVTPDGVALREKVQMLTAPSVDGEFGVLPGHRPLLAALKTGIVTYTKNGTEVRVAVGPGFVEVFEDRAVLLTDRLRAQRRRRSRSSAPRSQGRGRGARSLRWRARIVGVPGAASQRALGRGAAHALRRSPAPHGAHVSRVTVGSARDLPGRARAE